MIAAIAAMADTTPVLAPLVRAVGHEGTRRDAVVAYAAAAEPSAGWWLASLAAVVHRVAPGVRLM